MTTLIGSKADAVVEQRGIDRAVGLGYADALAEVTDRLRRIAATAQAGDGRHARVVPAVHDAVVHHFLKEPLTHDRVGHIEPCEFDLSGLRIPPAELVEDPVVQRTMILELQRADRVRDAFDCIFDRMCKVVHRIDAPFIPCVVVGGVRNAVDDRVTHVDIGAGHVDLGAQHLFAVLVFAFLHLLEERQVLLHGAVSVRALLAGLRQCAAVFADLVRRQVADKSLALFNQADRRLVHLVEIVGCPKLLVPLKSEPADILFDAVDVLRVLLDRIGVVIAQVAAAAVLLRRSEVEADRLGMPDVQVAVGFRRKTRIHLGVSAGRQIFVDKVVYKVGFGGFVISHLVTP